METTSSEPYYKKCSSDKDLATLTDWDESPPNILINFIYQIGKKPTLNCYDSESLKQWLNSPNIIFAKWVASPGKNLKPMGSGGEPDLNHLYVKLYGGEWIEYDDNVQSIRDGLKNALFVAIPAGVQRIGNLQGDLSEISTHHGQLPGYPTYKLQYVSNIPKTLPKEMSEEEEKEEEKEEGEEEGEEEMSESGEEMSEEEELFNEEDISFEPSDVAIQEAYQAVMNEILPLTGHYYRRWIPFPNGYTSNDIFNMDPIALLEYLKEQNFGDFAVQDLNTGYLFDISSKDEPDQSHWFPISEEQYLDYRDNRNRYSIVSRFEPEISAAMTDVDSNTDIAYDTDIDSHTWWKREMLLPYGLKESDILNPDPSFRDLVISYLLENSQGDFGVIDLNTGKLYDLKDLTDDEDELSEDWEEITSDEFREFRDNTDRYLNTIDQ